MPRPPLSLPLASAKTWATGFERQFMTQTFRLTLAQLNPTVGDFAGNIAKARTAWDQAKAAGGDMVALPEMFVTG